MKFYRSKKNLRTYDLRKIYVKKFTLLWASKFATAKLEWSFEMGK